MLGGGEGVGRGRWAGDDVGIDSERRIGGNFRMTLKKCEAALYHVFCC